MKFLKGLVITILSIIVIAFLNFGVIQSIIIPDPCLYHRKEITPTWELFYYLSAAEGYHPFPTLFNFSLTLIVGIIVGLILSKRILTQQNQD